MLRLKLESFDIKTDEKSYNNECNRQELLEVVVEDSSHGDKLLAILATRLGSNITFTAK